MLKISLNIVESYRIAGNELKYTFSNFIELEPQLEKAKVISGLKDALLVETLFNEDIIAGPTIMVGPTMDTLCSMILHKVLHDYLLIQGHSYQQYPSTNKLSYGFF